MKQILSSTFLFGSISFFGALLFFSGVPVSVGAGVGQGELCTGGPTKSDCASGLICVDNMQGGGVKNCQVPGTAADSSQRSTIETKNQPTGAGCYKPSDCASGFCDSVSGKCFEESGSSAGNAGNGDTSASPTPSAGSGNSGSAGNSTGAGGGSTSANRAGVATTGAATGQGLYIPPGSEVGLSDMRISDLIQNLMNWLLYIIGFIAIIAFVISGIQYLLAGADEEMAKKGKENMQYAIIGVIIALSALIIIRAIQSVLSGAWIF